MAKQRKLNIEKLKVNLVNYSDFEELVKKVYGQDYSYVADEEIGNDSYKFYQDIGSNNHFGYDENDLQDFKETGQGIYLARSLLEDLCHLEEIGPGNYLISVCW